MNSQENQRLPLSEYMPLLNPIYPKGCMNCMNVDEEVFMVVKQKIQREEFTKELNTLIEEIIPFGETNYTCWIAKKKIFNAKQTTIQHQDEYSASLLMDNEKNFQIWDYRTFIFETTKNHEKEYQIMDEILQVSPKNYHCWSTRVRVVDVVKNYSQEIERTKKYIDQDIFNNSPWTYRAHCFNNLLVKDVKAEVNFVLEYIKKQIDNEASWNYLRGMFISHCLRKLNFLPNKSTKLSFKDYPQVLEMCVQIEKNDRILQIQKINAFLTLTIIYSQEQEDIKKAIQTCKRLEELETDKKNYYEWLINSF